ncbi:flagellar hook-associated protein FlgK [Tepidanaerobacter sp. EBM-38]|uniref:flagellar hook-associated protein FlgK n=1 Tax=Tepidanaerobacter sp. EBM-38 TaxID=1918496 RepID=UPI000B236F5C|nr:flagellar hook-associated protein FlgK [Tepidanaerobacter sp. EBM-38]
MQSSFLGIEIAKTALFANQRAQQTVAHNVSNANTPGYSRQRVILEATHTAYGMGANWQIGTGVKVSDVDRIRDEFTDRQYRNENSSLGQWNIQSDILKQVEAVFNEPSDIGIASVLNEFWAGLETLSKDAASQEARETVKEKAITLANTINHAVTQLNDIVSDINYRISIQVNEVNSIASQIAQLNLQIRQAETGGASAADLKDSRDLLLDQLSNLVQFESYEDENGIFSVNVGGAILVKGPDSANMEFDTSVPNGKIKWKEYTSDVRILKGELKGLIELRDDKLENYLDQLDKFTQTFVDEFNAIHETGYNLDGETAIAFFEYANGVLSVNPDIVSNPSKIAAAEEEDGIPSDNRIALELANFRYKTIDIDGRNCTIDDYYGTIIAKIGVDSQEAARAADSQAFMVSQLNERRQMTSSVSLDEEMTKMIQYLHGYNAASRIVTTVDEMLDTIINRMGV